MFSLLLRFHGKDGKKLSARQTAEEDPEFLTAVRSIFAREAGRRASLVGADSLLHGARIRMNALRVHITLSRTTTSVAQGHDGRVRKRYRKIMFRPEPRCLFSGRARHDTLRTSGGNMGRDSEKQWMEEEPSSIHGVSFSQE